MILHFKNQSFFYSPELGKTLHKSYKTIESKVRKQLPDTPMTRSFQGSASNSKESMKLLFIISFLMSFFLNGGYDYMLRMLKTLQIIAHLPIMRVIFPANATMFLRILIPLVMFDILENDYGYDTSLFISYDDDGQDVLGKDLYD
jgi:hypothetical protein